MADHNLSAHHGPRHTTRPYWVTMGLLMLHLVATVIVAEVNLGPLNWPLAITIATAKAALILYFFMHVGDSKPLIWLFAGAGFFWFAILVVLTLSDFMTRS